MSKVVQEKLDSYLGNGARSSKFEILMTYDIPGGRSGIENALTILSLAKATSYPGIISEPAYVTHRGRKIPIKGQAKYDNRWSCTFYLDESHDLKTYFEDWLMSMNPDVYPDRQISQSKNSDGAAAYTTDIILVQLNYDGSSEKAKYTLKNAFPTNIGTTEADYTSSGSVLSFNVDFAYSHFTIESVSKDVISAAGAVSKKMKRKKLQNSLLTGGLMALGKGIGIDTDIMKGIAGVGIPLVKELKENGINGIKDHLVGAAKADLKGYLNKAKDFASDPENVLGLLGSSKSLFGAAKNLFGGKKNGKLKTKTSEFNNGSIGGDFFDYNVKRNDISKMYMA